MLSLSPHHSQMFPSNAERLLQKHLVNCERGFNNGLEL